MIMMFKKLSWIIILFPYDEKEPAKSSFSSNYALGFYGPRQYLHYRITMLSFFLKMRALWNHASDPLCICLRYSNILTYLSCVCGAVTGNGSQLCSCFWGRLVGEAAKLYKGNFQCNAGPEMVHPNLRTVAEDYNLSCFLFQHWQNGPTQGRENVLTRTVDDASILPLFD